MLYANSFNMSTIVLQQQGHIFGLLNGFGFNPLLFPMAVVFLISSMAETFRTPFDLTEAESELVAGFQTEYSSMSFALFWLGEYGNVILMCALNALLFWGGWLSPLNVDLIPWFDIPGILWLFGKMLFFFFVFSWVRATVPRYRYDQLMRLGWKIFLPLSLLFVFLVSGWLMLTRYSTEDRLARAEPSRAVLASIGASDVCLLAAPDKYGEKSAIATKVYLYRPPGSAQGQNIIEIKYPSELAGKLRFKMEHDNGYGGSGPLLWIGKNTPVKLGWAETDVIQDDRPGSILFYENGKDVKMGDCRTASELQA